MCSNSYKWASIALTCVKDVYKCTLKCLIYVYTLWVQQKCTLAGRMFEQRVEVGKYMYQRISLLGCIFQPRETKNIFIGLDLEYIFVFVLTFMHITTWSFKNLPSAYGRGVTHHVVCLSFLAILMPNGIQLNLPSFEEEFVGVYKMIIFTNHHMRNKHIN